MKPNGCQIITRRSDLFRVHWRLFLLSATFCIAMYNPLIINFVTKNKTIMRSTFKVLFYVNGSKEKNGIVPIMGRVTINGSVAQFSCKLAIAKELWDAKGNRAKGKGKEARDTNLALDNIKAQIIKHYQHLSDREAFVTAEMVRNAYQGIGTEYETLLGAFDKDNESFRKRIGTDRTLGSYQVRVRARNHLAAFIKRNYRRSDIAMLELTPDFIKEYEIYLSTDAGLHNASVWSNCMWLKTIVTKAHYNGLTPRNPFAQYRVNQNVKEREYLTEDEIRTVMTHEFADRKLAYIRDLFVFASFTAMSFVDIKELTADEIVEVNGEKWILSRRHKTKVPLPGEAAGHPPANHQPLRAVPGRQSRVPRPELLVTLQASEKDDKGMRHHKINLVPLQPPRIRDLGPEQGYAYREREPCSGAYEHNHDAKIREGHHRENRQGPDGFR